MTIPTPTLYESLGAQDGISDAVAAFDERVLDDPARDETIGAVVVAAPAPLRSDIVSA